MLADSVQVVKHLESYCSSDMKPEVFQNFLLVLFSTAPPLAVGIDNDVAN